MPPEEPRGRDHEVEGGDDACWLRLVCPACGALADEDPPSRCAACGARFPED